MKAIPTLLLILLGFTSCKVPQFIQGGEKDGVKVSYRWNHRADKPSELLLKIVNDSPSAQQLHLGLDLYYQAFTVEQFSADTCIPAGRTFNGKLNGIYFIPKQVTAEQAASPDTKVQLTEFTAERSTACP
ncbi:MAG: hypothetical protein WBB32_15910 [Flavobacteriales bacterium]